MVIRIMSAVRREHMTLVRRMREYYCLGRDYSHHERSIANPWMSDVMLCFLVIFGPIMCYDDLSAVLHSTLRFTNVP